MKAAILALALCGTAYAQTLPTTANDGSLSCPVGMHLQEYPNLCSVRAATPMYEFCDANGFFTCLKDASKPAKKAAPKPTCALPCGCIVDSRGMTAAPCLPTPADLTRVAVQGVRAPKKDDVLPLTYTIVQLDCAHTFGCLDDPTWDVKLNAWICPDGKSCKDVAHDPKPPTICPKGLVANINVGVPYNSWGCSDPLSINNWLTTVTGKDAR